VTGAVNVCVVAGLGRVFDVGGCDGNTTLPLLGRFVNGTIFEELCEPFRGLSLGDGGCEGGLRWLVLSSEGNGKSAMKYLSVIDVANGT
jgi:hypothetical protein